MEVGRAGSSCPPGSLLVVLNSYLPLPDEMHHPTDGPSHPVCGHATDGRPTPPAPSDRSYSCVCPLLSTGGGTSVGSWPRQSACASGAVTINSYIQMSKGNHLGQCLMARPSLSLARDDIMMSNILFHHHSGAPS